MQARMPEIPAPMTTTLRGRASSTDRSSMTNLGLCERGLSASEDLTSSGSLNGTGLGLLLKTRDRRFMVNHWDEVLEGGLKERRQTQL